LLDAFEQILAYNGISLNLFFRTLKPLEFVDLENAVTDEQVQEETGLELSGLSKEMEEFLELGEDAEQEGFELLDVRDVNYDLEDDFDNQVAEWTKELMPKPSVLSKIVNLIGTGRAAPNKPSEQDKEIGGLFFKVRYQYVGNDAPERGFCRAMMRASKVYRKEDITRLSGQVVNKGFGEGGSDTYSIWLYKGGPRCHHKWQRRTYVSFNKSASIGSPKTSQISIAKARKYGYRVANEPEVAMMPNVMPNKGFSPNNPNLPKDAR